MVLQTQLKTEYATSRFMKTKGSREDVWNGIAQETAGGLKKKDLMISKTGTIVSKKASESAKSRMKDGKGICEYCIEQYLKNKKGNSKSNSSEPKSSVKKTLKVKKLKNVSMNSVSKLEKEIEKLREKAGKIAEREGKMTKEVKAILEEVNKKLREMIAMKKELKQKKK